MRKINTLDDVELFGKTVLCRVDFNEPIDKDRGILLDITRIENSIQTIKELQEANAKTVILSHQGSDIEYQNYYSTKPHSLVLETLIGKKVKFIEDVCGPTALDSINKMSNGEIIFLDNVRFMAEEQTLFEHQLKLTPKEQMQTQVVKKIAPLVDIYINEAFSAAHRNQPSIVAFPLMRKSAMGRLFEKELKELTKVTEGSYERKRYILGGSKVDDAFQIIENLVVKDSTSKILVCGLVGNIFIASSPKGIGKESLDFINKKGYGKYIKLAKKLIERYPEYILVPEDVAYEVDNERMELSIEEIGDHLYLDIGSETIKKYKKELNNADMIFVNGPAGVFEKETMSLGTKQIWDSVLNSSSYTVIGGGDSITATNKFGKLEDINHVCTAGGAMIRFLTGEELPAIKSLIESREKFNGKL